MSPIIVGKVMFKDIRDIPSSVSHLKWRSVPRGNTANSMGIADNDGKGQRGGTLYYVAVEIEMYEDGVLQPFLQNVYFRVTDKRSDVHPAAHAAYDIVMKNMVSV